MVGLSATPYREDRISLLTVFPDDMIYVKDMYELVLEGYLADCIWHNVPTTLDLRDLSIEGILTANDKISKNLQQKIEASNRYESAFAYWWKVTGGKKRTAIFAQNTRDAYGFEKYFTERGILAIFINSDTPLSKRREIYTALKGNACVPVFYNVGTTGLDIPQMECIILGRATENRSLIHQIIGRGMRTCQEIDKGDCLIINLTNRYYTLCTIDFLAGRMEQPVVSMKQALQEKVEEEEKRLPKREEETPYEITTRIKTLKAHAYNAFTGDGWQTDHLAQTYTKHCGKYGTLQAEADFTGFSIMHIAPSGRRLRLSQQPLDFTLALYTGQKHIERIKAREQMQDGTSPRLSLPITEDQMKYLNIRRVYIELQPEEVLKQQDYIELKTLIERHGNTAYPTIDGVKYRIIHTYRRNKIIRKQTKAG